MTAPTEVSSEYLFTIGHSNHSTKRFLELLSGFGIEVLVDVRSQPSSKYARQFNAKELRRAVTSIGMDYLYLGEELGGRPKSLDFYDKDGHVLYNLVAESPSFEEGIKRLRSGLGKYRVAVMCSEEDPKDCHRRLLIGRVLSKDGITIRHIRGEGRVQTEEQLQREELGWQAGGSQLPMFEHVEEENWRSVKPILSASQSDEPRTFLEH